MKKVLFRFSLRSCLVVSVVAILSSAALATPLVPDSVNLGTLNTPVDPQKSTTLAERLAKRKAALKLKQTNEKKQTVVSKCQAAQIVLKKLESKSEVATKLRSEKYNRLATQLDSVIAKLEEQNVDTSQLKINQIKFNTSANKYLEDAMNARVALIDAANMDCVNDPVGFEASVLSARQLRTQLAKDAKEIKATVPLLRDDLEAARQVLVEVRNGEQ